MHVWVWDDDGGRDVLDDPPGVSDLAGPERWRQEVWGAGSAFGARLLPRLDGNDLWVPPGEVDDLLAECALYRRNLRALAEFPDHADTIVTRLSNIEAAARRARDRHGGVVVW